MGSSLIWVSTVCSDLSVPIFIIITVIWLYYFRYNYNDPELVAFCDAMDKLFSSIPGGFPEEKIPGLLYIWESKRRKQMKENCSHIMEFVKKRFDEHVETFDRGRCFDLQCL